MRVTPLESVEEPEEDPPAMVPPIRAVRTLPSALPPEVMTLPMLDNSESIPEVKILLELLEVVVVVVPVSAEVSVGF